MAGFHKVGPNEALIVSGGGKEPAVKVGGRKFVIPIIQLAQSLSLEVMTLTINTARVYTKEGVSVSVDGVAQVKVGRGGPLLVGHPDGPRGCQIGHYHTPLAFEFQRII